MLDDNFVDEWLFNLMLRREVLEDFEEPIRELVRLCRNSNEFEVIAHTMEHLIVLTSNQLSGNLALMAKHIKENVDDGSPLAIVGMAWGESPDSSQAVVQSLKLKFRKHSNVKLFNSVPEYLKKTYIQEYPRFVLVDDFSGTGGTIEIRMKSIMNGAKSKGVEAIPHICLMFGMDKAHERVVETWPNTHFCNKIKAGISGHFDGEKLAETIANMKRLEEELAPVIGEVNLPSFGHGESEALFFIKGNNAPNSNFPIFWWPIDVANKDRHTIMERAEL
ncbi:hypothetical protein N4R57_16415 [Rhodobacteraceae bacterium D3-12]|nr:hypothetical protein N4R57_16415 [Rhodobacteraceae bacterium D3-12]